MRILLFEDYPHDPENRVFRLRVRRELGPSVKFEEQKTVSGLEAQLTRGLFDVLILDIMARRPKHWGGSEGLGQTQDATVGLEILRRCRAGAYGDRWKSLPIFMRSARAEDHILRACREAGANGHFAAGVDDGILIAKLKELNREAFGEGC